MVCLSLFQSSPSASNTFLYFPISCTFIKPYESKIFISIDPNWIETVISILPNIEVDISYQSESFFFFQGLSLFRGATDTPVLDFRWRLPWASKSGWIPCALRAFSHVSAWIFESFKLMLDWFCKWSKNCRGAWNKVQFGDILSNTCLLGSVNKTVE